MGETAEVITELGSTQHISIRIPSTKDSLFTAYALNRTFFLSFFLLLHCDTATEEINIWSSSPVPGTELLNPSESPR